MHILLYYTNKIVIIIILKKSLMNRLKFLFHAGVHELPKTDYADDASSDSRSSSGQSISPVRCWPAIAGLPNNNNNNNNINNNNKTSSLRSASYDPKVINFKWPLSYYVRNWKNIKIPNACVHLQV